MTATTDRGAAARDAQATRERKRRDELAAAEAKALERRYQAWVWFVAEEQARLRATETTDDLTVAPALPKPDARITRAERKELSGLLEERRQREGVGADTASRLTLLEQIAAELDGRTHPDGWAVMAYAGDTTAFDHRAVLGRMRATDFAVPRRPWWLYALGSVAVLVVVCAVLAFLRSFAGSRTTPTNASVLIGGERVSLVAIQGAAFDGQPLTLQRSPAQLTTLCTNRSELLTNGKEATLVLTTALGIQTYAPTSPDQADLRIRACAGAATSLWAGRLQGSAVTSGAMLAPPRTVTVAGSATDPTTIAADQMRVTVQLADARCTTCVLALSDGTRWPGTLVGDAAQPTLQFLVPRHETAQRAALVRTESIPPQLLPLDLPPPASRLSVLQTQVRVTDVQAWQEQDGSLVVTVNLAVAPGNTPPLLLLEDVFVLNSQQRPLDVRWMPPTLAVSEPTTVEIVVMGPFSGGATVIVAGQQFAIRTQ